MSEYHPCPDCGEEITPDKLSPGKFKFIKCPCGFESIAVRLRKKASGNTFHRPENFEKIETITGPEFECYVSAGANDWELGFTWAAVYPKDAPDGYGDEPAVWIEIDHASCPGCKGGDMSELSTRGDAYDKCLKFGKKVVKDWIEGAHKNAPDTFEAGFEQSAEDGKNIRTWGLGKVKAAAANIPLTGPDAIYQALQRLKVDRLEEQAKAIIRSGKVTKRPGAVHVLNALEGLKRNNLTPSDLMSQRVPVIPPAFRPFSMMGNTFVPGDANELYKDLFELRDNYTDAVKMFGPEGAVSERIALMGAVKALYGYGDPVKPKTKQRGVSGFIKQVTGTNPKFGTVQRRLISKPQDSVSRGVVIPGADLGLDEIGVPEDMAWTMYAPYIQRRLTKAGFDNITALKNVKDRTAAARRALELELDERPTIYSRAPSWHKFNVLAGRARLIPGNSIATNPFVSTGLNLDHDGDTVNLHVPSQPDAVREAHEVLMPSKMLFSIRDQNKVMPVAKHEQVLSLFTAGQRPAKQVHRFGSQAEALKALQKGDISLADEIEFPDEEGA